MCSLMSKTARGTAALVMAMCLSGCAVFGGSGKTASANQSSDLSSYFAQRLETGKELLKAKLPARAVVAFRQASYDPNSAAEAFNGMGVAYIMQRRPDVARQMFRKAIASNPYDERFARNLARLELRVGKLEQRAQLSTSTDGPATNALSATDVSQTFDIPLQGSPTATSSGGIRSNDARETFISTSRSDASSRQVSTMLSEGSTSDRSINTAAINGRSTSNPAIRVLKPSTGYPVRIALDGRSTSNPANRVLKPSTGYPVRIALGSRKVAKSAPATTATQKTAHYPIRVAFSENFAKDNRN